MDDGQLRSGLGSHFTENRGQYGYGAGLLYTRGEGLSAAFGQGHVRYVVQGTGGVVSAFDMVLESSNDVEPTGSGSLEYRTDFFRGRDPDGWVTGARNYRSVRYTGVYDRVDLEFRYSEGALKYEFRVAPGGDPCDIRMRYEGVEGLAVEGATGDLLVKTASGTLRDEAPLSYQPLPGGAKTVGSGFALLDGGVVGFRVADHDPSLPLVIDPGLVFGTLVGSSYRDVPSSMFVDGAGDIWVTGSAGTGDFPTTPGAYQTDFSGGDAFVLRFDANGSSLLYSSFIGGWSSDTGRDLHVDGAGLLYLVGLTTSDDFPVTDGAYCQTLMGPSDVFIMTLDVANSTLVHSTLLGGATFEYVGRCHFGERGLVYVTGATNGTDYPTTAGSYDTSYNGGLTDAFLSVYDVTTSSLRYSTLLGGSGDDYVMDIHVDGSDTVYLCGYTASVRFPTTSGAYDTTFGGSHDGFALRLNVTTSILEYSTYLGDTSLDQVNGLAVDPQGRAYVVGQTFSTSFPTTQGAYDRYLDAWSDIFVLQLDEDGSDILHSTFLGEGNPDYGSLVGLDEDGRVYVVGYTYSREFPVTGDAFDQTFDGERDMVLARFDANLTTLEYATYLGGDDEETPARLIVEGPGNLLLTGNTRSTTAFPTTPGAYQTALNGYWEDVFVLRMDIEPPAVIADQSQREATTGDPFHVNVTVEDNLRVSSVVVQYSFGAGAPARNATCQLVSGTTANGSWSATIDVPGDSLDALHYRVEARDTANNTVQTGTTVVDVLDDDAPLLTADSVPEEAPEGRPLPVWVEVQDNIGVKVVKVRWYYGLDPSRWEETTLEPGQVDAMGNGRYLGTIVVSSPQLETLHVAFNATDPHGNSAQTDWNDVRVLDDERPWFGEDLTPGEATTGDPLEVSIEVLDNVGVDSVWVSYWYGRGQAENVSLVRGEGSTWHATIHVRHTSQEIYYVVNAKDTSGNWNWTGQRELPVLDNDAPELVADRTPSVTTTGDILTIEADLWDNLGIVSAWVHFRYGDEDTRTIEMAGEVEGGTRVWTFTVDIDVPMDTRGPIRYHLEAGDPTGNRNVTVERAVEVLDDDPPELDHYHGELHVTKGLDSEFHVDVRDNIQVAGVTLTYRFGDGPEESLPMEQTPHEGEVSCQVVVPIPRWVDGPVRYMFTAEDASGNRNSTEWYEGVCANRPPELAGDPPVWVVVEEDPSALDLGGQVIDGNDPASSLNMTCDAPNVWVDGLILKALYDVWTPEHRLEVTVTDGEDTLRFEVTVQVTNVNDAPFIQSVLPESGTRYRRGETVRFVAVATDEDGDELTYTWRDGDRVIGVGAELDHRGLPEGERDITLEVTDGTDTAARTVIIVVEERNEPLSSLAIWLLAALAVAAVSIATYAMSRRRRAD